MTSIYRAVFRNALKILWQFKYLWFFGIFAVFLEMNRLFNLIGDKFSQVIDWGPSLVEMRYIYNQGMIGNFWQNFKDLILSFDVISWLLLTLTLLLGLFILWLSLVSQGSLFWAGAKLFKKQKINFASSFKIGIANFWKILWLNIISRLFSAVLWLILGLPLFLIFISSGAEWGKLLFILISFLITLPVALIIAFIFRYAALFVVYKKLSTKPAIVAAWRLFKSNWLVSVEMEVALFVVDILVLIGFVVLAIIVALPFALIFNIFQVGALNNLATLIISIIVVLWFILGIFVWAASSVFRHISWAILFVRISEGNVAAKIVRLFSSQPSMIDK